MVEFVSYEDISPKALAALVKEKYPNVKITCEDWNNRLYDFYISNYTQEQAAGIEDILAPYV